MAHRRYRSRTQGSPTPSRPWRSLPEPQRRALTMFYLGGFSVLDIAQLEGVPDGTVKARLSRGRQALAAALRTSTEATAK